MPRQHETLTADDLRVLSVRECAALNNLSWITFKRLIKAGDGPQIVQLSPRRIGIRVIDNRRWQESRLRSASRNEFRTAAPVDVDEQFEMFKPEEGRR